MTNLAMLQLDDYWKFRWLQAIDLSPDGTKIVYAVAHYDADDDKDKTVIWLMDVASGESRQMTSGIHSDSAPRFSPDGKFIGFVSDRSGGKPQLFQMPVDGGEAQPLTSIPQGIREGPVWSPDGKWIAFTAGLSEDDMPDMSKPYRIKRDVYRFNGVGMIDAAIQQIYIMPAEGGEPQQLTDEDVVNTGIRWSPDSTRILYGAGFRPKGFMNFMPALNIVTTDGDVSPVLDEWGTLAMAEWIDDTRLALIGAPQDRPMGAKNDLYTFMLGADAPECRTAGAWHGAGGGLQFDYPAGQLAFDTRFRIEGDAAYVPVERGGCISVAKIALSGDESIEFILEGERAVSLKGMSDSHLIYIASDFTHTPDIYMMERSSGEERRLTMLNDDLLASVTLPEIEHLKWKSNDGTEVEGWYLKPPQGEAPYPTILYIHGGPYGAFGYTWSCDFHLLAGAGYGVLAVNYRGSTGYGDEFGTGINGDWGNRDYQDMMTGIDHVIEHGLADADKLGVGGLSAGGYHTCWIVGQTDRFKAAIPENPVSNLVTLYTMSDIGPWILAKSFNGTIYTNIEAYLHSSPITHAHNCKTPTLLVQGEADLRCPPEQSEQFYIALKTIGCTVEMLRLPGADHAGAIMGAPAVRRAQNEAMLGWYNRYVRGIDPDD